MNCEQTVAGRYATVLRWGLRLGLVVLFGCWLLELAEQPAPRVAAESVHRHWHLSHGEFAAATGRPTGWAALLDLGHSDAHSLLAVAGLALLSLAALVSIVPAAVRRRDGWFVAALLAQIAILALAASGLLSTGAR